MRHHTTSCEIGTAAMATLHYADCGPWAFVTSPSHHRHPGRTAVPNRECVDHIVVWGEGHLRRILRAYARYYNNIRTHRSLDKDAPAFRSVQRVGTITSHAILGGLHHHYVRV